jgi:hypothetical protein
MEINFSGTVSFQNITHIQVQEKIHDFTELVGRSPKLTVQPAGKVNFYPVVKVMDTTLLIKPAPNALTTVQVVAPVAGVYESVAMF